MLSCQNCLRIEELLDPDHENELVNTNITDKEIVKAVCAKHAALDNLEINGGNNDDNDIEIIKKPDC